MRWIETRIPPPLWALLSGAGMWLLARHWPLAASAGAWRWSGVAVIAAGLALDVWSILHFRRVGTTVNPLAPNRSTAIVESGPFARSRNPMYVGMLLWLSGWGLWLGALSPFALLPLFVLVLTKVQIIPEERVLAAKFGDAYRHYCDRVPRWL